MACNCRKRSSRQVRVVLVQPWSPIAGFLGVEYSLHPTEADRVLFVEMPWPSIRSLGALDAPYWGYATESEYRTMMRTPAPQGIFVSRRPLPTPA